MYRILHLTDFHLLADKNAKFLGIKPYDSFICVIDAVKTKIEAGYQPDLLLLTGDLAHDRSAIAYRYIVDAFSDFKQPISWIPGNHDDPKQACKVFDGTNIRGLRSYVIGNWQIILLNSYWQNHVSGRLDQMEFTFLSDILQKQPAKHALIFLHHHAISSKSHWLDASILVNSGNFLSLVDKYSNIKAVIYGHVHQDIFTRQNGVIFSATPATSVQFLSAADDFALDTAMPGFRWIDLYRSGAIKTDVQRISYSQKFIPDSKIKGY